MSDRTWTLPEERERLTRKQFVELFMRQDGRCANEKCGQKLPIKGGRVVCVDEHVNPLWRGGSNDLKNRELWCKPCTRPKTAKEATERGKVNRVRDKHIGAPMRKSRPMPFGRDSKLKKKITGEIVPR